MTRANAAYPSGVCRLARSRKFLLTVVMEKPGSSFYRLKVVASGRYRRRSFEEKLRIVEESFCGDRQVTATAHLHGVSRSLLFKWRRAYRAGELGRSGASSPGLVPAVMKNEIASASPSSQGGQMEIVTSVGGRVIVGSDVDAAALLRVISVLEGR